MNKFAVAALLLGLTGCSSVPSGAPTNSQLLAHDDSAKAPFDYELFDITANVARIAGARTDDTFAGRFGGRGAAGNTMIGRGDTLSISIFEASNNGLFTSETVSGVSAGAKNVTLPQVLVDARGFIRVPYADEIQAAGRTPREIEAAIEARLKGRAIEPQVIVSTALNRSQLVTVSGEVRSPGRLPIQTASERLLDAISEAGGPSLRAHEATVTLVRGDRRATASLKSVFDNPSENIFIQPGDTILVQRRLRSITILGAEARNTQLPFDNDTMTLSEAIGNAGGLDDNRASLEGVYVFRQERPDIVRRMRAGWIDRSRREQVSTLYRLDLRNAQGYFLAEQFQLRDHDLLFAANADGTQYLKTLQLVGSFFGATASAATTAAAIKAVK